MLTMTKRGFRFSFRLRSLLVCFICISLLLALYVHFDRLGRSQLSAVESIERMDVAAYTTDSLIELQTLNRRDKLGRKIVVPVLSDQEPGRVTQIGRRLLGDVIFTKYTSIIVDESLGEDTDAFQQHISQLPYLDTIYYYENTLDQSSLDEITRNYLDLKLVQIPGSPLRMPGRSAMQRYVD